MPIMYPSIVCTFRLPASFFKKSTWSDANHGTALSYLKQLFTPAAINGRYLSFFDLASDAMWRTFAEHVFAARSARERVPYWLFDANLQVGQRFLMLAYLHWQCHGPRRACETSIDIRISSCRIRVPTAG